MSVFNPHSASLFSEFSIDNYLNLPGPLSNPGLNSEKLIGNVKLIHEAYFRAEEREGKIVNIEKTYPWDLEMEFDQKGNKIRESAKNGYYLFSYDQKGNLIEIDYKTGAGWSDIFGFFTHFDIHEKYAFTYNTKDLCQEVARTRMNKDGTIDYTDKKIIYTYNDDFSIKEEIRLVGVNNKKYRYYYNNNRLKKKEEHSLSEKAGVPVENEAGRIEIYDDSGRIAQEEVRYAYSPKYWTKIDYIYDKDGNLNLLNEYSYNTNILVGKSVFSNGNLSEKITYEISGELKERYTFQYDEFNNLTEKKLFNYNDKLYHLWQYKYEYDKEGNWISQTLKSYDTDPDLAKVQSKYISLIKRKIKYYKSE